MMPEGNNTWYWEIEGGLAYADRGKGQKLPRLASMACSHSLRFRPPLVKPWDWEGSRQAQVLPGHVVVLELLQQA